MNKVLGYYGAELFTEYTDNATFIMETCYTADDYDVFWCHPKDEMIDDVQKALSWFRKNNPKAYMVLLD